MPKEALEEALAPFYQALLGADLEDPALAGRLGERLPLDGPECTALRAAAEAGLEEGWLCPREAGGIPFGRPVKPGPDSAGYSVDAVVMDEVQGPVHTHTHGEIDLCFAQDGDPRFDGHPAGWVTFPPGSTHAPVVTGGRMLIIYFLPEGAIEFHN